MAKPDYKDPQVQARMQEEAAQARADLYAQFPGPGGPTVTRKDVRQDTAQAIASGIPKEVALNAQGVTTKEIDEFNSAIFEGTMDNQGRIWTANQNGKLIEGRARDLSDGYARFVIDAIEWSNTYPMNDARTWLPLVRKQVKAGDLWAHDVMAADGENLSKSGGIQPDGSIRDTRVNKGDPDSNPDPGTGGLTGFVTGAAEWVGDVGGAVIGSGLGAADAVGGFIGDNTPIDEVWDKSRIGDVAYNAANADVVKAASRNFFAAVEMPKQAITSQAAIMAKNMEEGDYFGAVRSAILFNPVLQAVSIGLDNVQQAVGLGDVGPRDPNAWDQTDMGQTILDISGQGRGEQTGAYDDPMGLQAEQGSGFFMKEETPAELANPISTDEGAETTVSAWQREARLEANTIVEAVTLSDQSPEAKTMRKQMKLIARSQSPEEAAKHAMEQGYLWNEENNTFTRPALGWSWGRAVVKANHITPYSEQWNTWSGAIDFVTDIGFDPAMYTPAGVTKLLTKGVLGGRKVAGGDAAGYIASRFSTPADELATQKEILEAIRESGDDLFETVNHNGQDVLIMRDEDGLGMFRQVWEDVGTGKEARAEYGKKLPKDMRVVGDVVEKPKWTTVGTKDEADQFISEGGAVGKGTDYRLTKAGRLQKAEWEPVGTSAEFAENKVRRPAGHRVTGGLAQKTRYERVGTETETFDALAGTDVRVTTQRFDVDFAEEGVVLSRPTTERVLTADEIAVMRETKELESFMARGGIVAQEKAWDAINSARMLPMIRGIAEATNPYEIYVKSKKMFTPELVSKLSRTTDIEETRRILAPHFGAEIIYENDLARFAFGQPNQTFMTRAANATDLARLGEKWVQHVPGQSFIPGSREFDMTHMPGTIEALQRSSRVAITGIDGDPEWLAAMGRVVATSDSLGRAGIAKRWRTIYGEKGTSIILDPDGNDMGTLADLNRLFGKDMSLDDLKARGYNVSEVTEDGVFAVIMRKLVDENGIDPQLARTAMKAWNDGEDQLRWYAQDGTGKNWMLPWMDEEGVYASPFREADVLTGMAALPDFRQVRALMGTTAKMLRKAEKAHRNDQVKMQEFLFHANELFEGSMYRWKQLTLMSGGLRWPAYTMRQVLDTHIAVGLHGAPSLFRDPMMFLGLLLTSSIRKVEGRAPSKGVAKLGEMATRSDLGRMIFRKQLNVDAKGEYFDEGWAKAANGDPNGMDDFRVAMNASAGARGSQGQDVLYNQAARVSREFDRTNPKQIEGFVYGQGVEIHKMAVSGTFRRLAGGDESMESLLKWFNNAKQDGKIVISELGPRAAQQLSTEAGTRAYLQNMREYLLLWTGGDEDLLKAVHTGKFNGEPLWSTHPGKFERTLNKDFRKHLDTLAKDPPTDKYPTRINTVPPEGPMGAGNRKGWDSWHRNMFHAAGRFEDIYGREGFMKFQYWKHVMDDLGPNMTKVDRMAMAQSLRATGNPKYAKRLERMAGDGHLTRDMADQIAWDRAGKDMRDVAYNAANRREWAYAIKVLGPFAQATINGMYRWSKNAIQNPEQTYRFLKAGEFLSGEDSAVVANMLATGGPSGDPFIFEDPNSGERRVSIPFAGSVMDVFAAAMPQFGLPTGAEANLSMSAASLNMAFPNYERTQQDIDEGKMGPLGFMVSNLNPGLGPAVTAPISLWTNGSNQFVNDYLLPYGTPSGNAPQKLTQTLLPRQLQKFLDIITPVTAEAQARQGRDALTFAALLSKEEGTDWSNAAEANAVMDRGSSIARGLAVVEFFASSLMPAASKTNPVFTDPRDIPNHMIYAEEMSSFLYNYQQADDPDIDGDWERAKMYLVREFGLGALALTVPSTANSDAAPPYASAMALHNQHPEAYAEYGPILGALLETRSADEWDTATWTFNKETDQFDLDVLAWQMNSGQRPLMSYEDRKAAARQTILSYAYENRLKQINDSLGTDMDKLTASNQLRNSLTAQGWENQFDITSPQKRQVQMNLLLKAAEDDRMDNYIPAKTADMLVEYLMMRNRAVLSLQARGTGGDLKTATSTGAEERDLLFFTGEDFANRNDSFNLIWQKMLRSEVVDTEGE